MTKNLKGFEKGFMTGMILIDLQKIFDTIDHDALLQKLCTVGFSKHTVNCFQSYLSSRSFLVNLGINFSQSACCQMWPFSQCRWLMSCLST